MGPELRQLRYLLAVAEHGSFTRAAEALGISQPTLSQQIRHLERTLGVQLLDRSGRTVRPTDAGETYLRYARRALRDLAAGRRAVMDVQDLARGHLRLAMAPTFTAYLTGPLAAEFHTRYPALTLEVRELEQERIEEALLGDELDLGIGFGTAAAGVECSELFTETLSLVTGREHPRAAGGVVAVAELTGMRLALLGGDAATRAHVEAYFAAHRARPVVAVEAASLGALTGIVQRTGLATVLPDAVTRDHRELAPLALEPALPARTVSVLRREGGYPGAAALAFTRLARHWARDHAGGRGDGAG
jgi:LysR family transcriptional regulator, cyn operon transcriptional activator